MHQLRSKAAATVHLHPHITEAMGTWQPTAQCTSGRPSVPLEKKSRKLIWPLAIRKGAQRGNDNVLGLERELCSWATWVQLWPFSKKVAGSSLAEFSSIHFAHAVPTAAQWGLNDPCFLILKTPTDLFSHSYRNNVEKKAFSAVHSKAFWGESDDSNSEIEMALRPQSDNTSSHDFDDFYD
ncbi:hypothetical protein DNTS_024902 [Danionella cerebrum]|uniref:Centrosomal protein kizuna n=1 Tax=Danionella cerebrum TaxID=2873325 RepID=A0A553QSV3_9TELE|nr:hypothetical protein DNTS_024902 [Danionella translucida]